jgi:hypothetical protein
LGAYAAMPAARPPGGRGILSWFVPPALAGEVAREAAAERDALLAAAGEKVPRRRSRLLPPHLAVYFTLALCLLARLPYQDALRSVAGDGATGLPAPATTALTAARRRLGERPLELLFQRVAGILLPSRDPWATVRGLLVAAWDGTTLKAPASPENTAAFGRPRGGGKKPGGGKAPPVEGHYPHVRVVALIACGTGALLGAAIGPFSDGEQKLAAALTARLQPGMLLLADRGFWSHALWGQCAAAGAGLLWRVKSDIRLPVRQQLPDGSWLSVANGTREAHRRNMRNANRRSRGSRLPQEQGPLPGDVTVRVIEFLITLTRTERYRAVTTLLDWRRYPAAAYARRWGIETAYREAKSYLAGSRVLRSRTPGLARQETWALLIAYQVFLRLAADALQWCGASRADPLLLEGLRERFLPECAFRGRQNAKLQYAVLAAAAVHGGTEPDLPEEVAYWQADDFWQYAAYAAVAYIRAAASRAGVSLSQACQELDERPGRPALVE